MLRVILLLTLLVSAFAESGGPTADPGTTGGTAATGAPASGAAAPSTGFPQGTILMMGGLGVLMWLFLIRPQKKEEKKRQELISSMKPGHKVITIGGIHGEVTTVGETTVEIRVSDEGKGMIMTFNKGAVATNVTATAAATPATTAK